MLARLALLVLLADPPAPAAAPAKRTCYAASCNAVAQAGEPVRVRAQCIAGYQPETAIEQLGNGCDVILCICCPAVAAAATDVPATPTAPKGK